MPPADGSRVASYTEIDQRLPVESEGSLGSVLAMLDDDTDHGGGDDEEATEASDPVDDGATCMRAPIFEPYGTPSENPIEGIASELEPSLATCSSPFLSMIEAPRRARTREPRLVDTQGVPLIAPPLPHQDALGPGGYVGKYQLVERLGQGAFGFVFVAHDTELGREVALKILNPTHLSNADVLHRFLQEARTTARIAHPGIVTILDSGQVITASGDTTAFIAMELLHGESLTERLARHGQLDPRDAVEIVRQIASALDAAHRAQVLHRDLKPDNIYLVADPAMPTGERVKVFDFGLAKLGRVGQTQVESIFGTPRYMSPEQWRSAAQIDARSDIYALGCILYELVTGETPFVGKLRELFEMHSGQLAPRASVLAPHLPSSLDDLIAAMLAKDPGHRPPSMDALCQVLVRIGAMIDAGVQDIARGSAPMFEPTSQPPPLPARLPDGTHARTTYRAPTAVPVAASWKAPLVAFLTALLGAGAIHWL